MSYRLIDVNERYLGDLASTVGMDGLRRYAERAKAEELLGFLDKGAALVTGALMEELEGLRPKDPRVREILSGLVDMLERAEFCVLIEDDVNERWKGGLLDVVDT